MPSSRIGEKYPTKVKPVHKPRPIQRMCLNHFFTSFSRDIGAPSRRMRALRSPSTLCSIHRNISVYTVCGQAKPHHRRPATAVNRNSESALITSRAVR